MRARLYSVAASTSLRERTMYLGNFTASMLTYGLFVFIFSRVWAGAYAGRSEIAGYTQSMAVWYFIVAEITSFGFGRYFWGLSRDVKSGQVAYQLGRPYDFVAYNYAERVGGSLADAAVILAEGLAVGFLLVGTPPSAGGGLGAEILRGGLLAVSLLLAGSLNFLLHFSISLTAFWLEENDAFYWVYQKLVLVVGTLVPIEFLPDTVAAAALWTPFPYLSWAPARVFVAFSPADALSLIARQLAWVAFAVLLARAVFSLSSRRVALNGG
ncbi:MAG: ABC-2 family transporter protein [Spirochaetales bacterium]|nr:ABC-2 family transporter protein [Spirochaetales bacterium]